MLLRRGLLTILLVLFSLGSAFAATPESTGLYLAFEQRMALSFALLAQGESQDEKEKVLSRARMYFEGMIKRPIETVVVSNFDEFLKKMRGEWPNTHSLALDMELLEKAGPPAIKVYTAKSPRIQRQIERYLKWQTSQLAAMALSQSSAEDLRMNEWGRNVEKVLAADSLASVKQVAKNWILETSETILVDRMKELDRVGEKVAEASFAKQQDPAARIFMQTLLGQYFSRLGLASKKMIVSSFIGGNLLADDMKKFEIMVQNSGTVLQKLLQVVARQANLPPDVQAVFRTLESSVRPVPWVLVDQIVKQESGNYKFTYFERKPLGVGTMAQVHRAKIDVLGRRHDVVARFIKPGADVRTEEDRRILSEIAPIIDSNPDFIKMQVPKMVPIVEDIIKTVTAEFDQEATKARQKNAKVYERVLPFRSEVYQSEIEFHVPDVYDAKKPTQLMVQEMVIGGKLDKQATIFEQAIPELKRVAVEAMAKVWVQEALFGSGFYHSDLHQGNFMINVKEPKIIMNILDFGMGGVISPELQRQVMVLGVGTEINSADLIAKSFWDLSDKPKNTVSEAEFKEAVHEKTLRIRRGQEPAISMELWMAWALNKGLGVPYDFVSLNRGMAIVNKLLEESGSKLDLTKITKMVAKQHPALVYDVMVIREKVPVKDLVRMGWREMQNVFQGEPHRVRGFQLPSAMTCGAVFQ